MLILSPSPILSVVTLSTAPGRNEGVYPLGVAGAASFGLVSYAIKAEIKGNAGCTLL